MFGRQRATLVLRMVVILGFIELILASSQDRGHSEEGEVNGDPAGVDDGEENRDDIRTSMRVHFIIINNDYVKSIVIRSE